jgi:tetratricopeptide (TPR) repeat protein
MTEGVLIPFNKYHYLIVVVTLIVFAFGLNNQFNSWDDTVYVTENPSIALNGQHIKQSFFKGETHGMYLPLTALSFSMNYNLAALNPKPYLVVNLIIHLLNIFLVIALLQKLFKNNTLTLFAGALFALHPLQAESISYVAGRRDTLYAVFYFLSLLSYIHYITKKEKKWLYAALAFFILSLFSKGQAIALPATLVLIDFILLKNFSLVQSIKDKWLFIVLSVLFMGITLAVKQQSKAFNLSGQILHISFFQNMLFACYGFMMYVVNSIIPYKLSLIHPYPKNTGITGGIMLALIFVIAFIWFVFRYSSRQKEIVAGLLFFAINIFLVLQLIPNSYGLMNDHYMYVPVIGIFVALYMVITKLAAQKTVAYVCISLVVVFAVLLTKRIAIFKNNFTVFTDVIKKYPDSFVGYNNRGVAYFNDGKFKEAKMDFDQSISLAPEVATSYNNRAGIFINLNRNKEAVEDLNKAIALKPDFANAYSNRGIALSMLGDARALEDLDKAIAINAMDPKLYYNRAGYWMNRNQKDRACQDVAKARSLGLKVGNPALDKICQ